MDNKCNTCALAGACNDYDEYHCKENGYRRYEPIFSKELNSVIKRLRHRLKRAEEKYLVLKSKEEKLSEHGHWELGFWQGRIATLEDLIDELED